MGYDRLEKQPTTQKKSGVPHRSEEERALFTEIKGARRYSIRGLGTGVVRLFGGEEKVPQAIF